MEHADFVHLRVHTAYSLSEGALKIKDLIKLCAKQRFPAVGIADTGNLFGALEFSIACAEAGIQPIIGAQIAITREDSDDPRDLKKPAPDPLVLLAQDATGYGHLLKLVSKAFLESDPGEAPQVRLSDLENCSEGLLLLTGGTAGPVGRLILEGQKEKAQALLLRLHAAFSGRLYVEIQRHGTPEQARSEGAFLDLAYTHDLPLVATNEVFFADEGMYEAHDALLCIAEGTYVSVGDRRRLTPEHRLKSAEEMRALFADLPEAVDNTLVIARRCAVMSDKRKPILPTYPNLKGRTEEDALRQMAEDGLEQRLLQNLFTPDMDDRLRERAAKTYRERLEYELGVIVKMGFSGYFLIVADFIQWAKHNGVPVGPGRGSGAGSLVAWALTITDLDPLRFGLLFERFLNPERVSMPDFDIDFCQEGRDRVIEYVQNEYGKDRVAQIITFGKLQARAVLRDVGRVLQMPYGYVDKICKLVPQNPANPVNLKQALEMEPLLPQMRDADETVARMIDIGMKLEGLYRHASTHAAGVVIGDRPLDELIPLYRDPRSPMPVTQFSMKWAEAAGLVKFDFLGLKTLTVLARALALLKLRNITIDLSALPLDDRATFDMLGRGDTVGVFQLESSGMRDVLRQMRPDTLEDIIAVVALYRPGPMDNIPKYIRCKHGKEEPDYLHPSLEPILKETFGIMVYQEQVMQIAQVLSGYSLGGADLLRRAMGKKIKEEMEAQRKVFADGAVARGVDAAQASHIFDLVAKFADYGFNKSHAAAYALVAYQTAYLKANYPVEFVAASMTLDMGNTDKLNMFRQELDRLEIRLLPPDINRSDAEFTVEDGAVRYALAAIKNVGGGAMRALVDERDKGGAFKSLEDFAHRLDAHAVNKRQMENLARAGAFDALEKNRARLFEGIEILLREAQAAAEERTTQQANLFGGGEGGLLSSTLRLPERSDWSPMEKLREEFAAIGFYLSAHPLDAYARSLERLSVLKVSELTRHLAAVGPSRVKLAGIVTGKQERTAKSGSRFAFVQCSDATGSFEATVFSEVLATARDLLVPGTPLLITAHAELQEEQLRITVNQIESLDAAAAKVGAGLKIRFREAGAVKAIKDILARERRGKGSVILAPEIEGKEVEIRLKDGYGLSANAISTVQTVPGVVSVQEI